MSIRLLLAIITLGLSGCAHRSGSSAAIGQPLPPLTLELQDGSEWTPKRVRGSVLIVDVWASWCKPCRKGFSRLGELARRRPEVELIAVSIDETMEEVERFLAEVAVEFPVAHDLEQTVTQPPLSVARVPTIFVVDRSGVVRYRFEEPSDRDYDEIESRVDELGLGN